MAGSSWFKHSRHHISSCKNKRETFVYEKNVLFLKRMRALGAHIYTFSESLKPLFWRLGAFTRGYVWRYETKQTMQEWSYSFWKIGKFFENWQQWFTYVIDLQNRTANSHCSKIIVYKHSQSYFVGSTSLWSRYYSTNTQ